VKEGDLDIGSMLTRRHRVIPESAHSSRHTMLACRGHVEAGSDCAPWPKLDIRETNTYMYPTLQLQTQMATSMEACPEMNHVGSVGGMVWRPEAVAGMQV